jgi:hypothetical protein
MSDGAPKPPTGTRAAGLRLWSSVVDEYDLDEHELALLTEATRTVDLLTQLDVAVRRAPSAPYRPIAAPVIYRPNETSQLEEDPTS